jgi:hypothetical protein
MHARTLVREGTLCMRCHAGDQTKAKRAIVLLRERTN